MSVKKYLGTEVSDKLQCQRQTGNPYNIYMPVMQPTSLLATTTVLKALKVHRDWVNFCHCLSC